jgi:glycine/D-amino acid oxidase-like deaminating enzyme
MKLMGLEAVEIVRERVERSHRLRPDLGLLRPGQQTRRPEGFAEDAEELRSLGYRHEPACCKGEMHSVVGSDRYVGGLIDMGSGHLHPLNLALGEAAAASRLGVQLFEQSAVTRIDYGPKSRCTPPRAGPRQDPGAGLQRLPQRPQPHWAARCCPPAATSSPPNRWRRTRTQLLPQNMAVCDQRVALDYYRLSADHRLLFGGACHYSGRDPKDIAAYMRPKMLGCSRNWPTCASTTSGAA